MKSVTQFVCLVSSPADVMTGNPLLVVFLAASLFSVGIRIFRKVKGAAKG